jgi:hypothetical protein
MIKELLGGIVGTVVGLTVVPPMIKALEDTYPKWMRYGSYHAKVTIPNSVKTRLVWLFSPDGKAMYQMEYLTARRIRARYGWVINIKEPKFIPGVQIRAIVDLMPMLLWVGLVGAMCSGFKHKNAHQ